VYRASLRCHFTPTGAGQFKTCILQGGKMVELGYALSSEEHPPNELVHYARRAEEVGFTFALISDHYHPWIDQQGQAPFVWSVIGAISAVTQRLRLGTGVTCPIMRIHPAIIAQAAATSAAMMPGRFFLGLGAGEALNEHILGEHWPVTDIRQDMLEEAVDILRLLWQGEEVSYWGDFFDVENARIYTLPDPLPPIYIASSGVDSAALAAEIGDGLITTKADEKVASKFENSGGKGKPRIGQVKVCWAETENQALDTVYKYWPTETIPGPLHSDLPTPDHFEAAVKLIHKEDLRQSVVLGPDPQRHLEKIQKYVDLGYDQVYVHQVGPDQEGFFRFYEREILPKFKG
jgi:coenzyme F420-dependent glucose-6-phosphate dehydrogenase